MGHSLAGSIAVRFEARHPDHVAKLVLFDGGLDVRPEVLDSIGPSIARLGVEFPSLDAFVGLMKGLPFFAGRWNDHLTRYFAYDVEPAPGGGVRSKVAKHAIEEEVRALHRTRLRVWHHPIRVPPLLLRAPDALVRDDDSPMTEEQAAAMAPATPACRRLAIA